MPQDLISRYKRSPLLKFQKPEMETRYRELQEIRGRSSSVFAFCLLLLLSAVFAYLEYRAFGHDIPIPMYGHLVAAVLALANLLISRFSGNLYRHNLRLLVNGIVAIVSVIAAMYLQKYSAYHVIELILLLVWMGALTSIRLIPKTGFNLAVSAAFVGVMYLSGESLFWINLVSLLLGSAVLLAAYIGYLAERNRRMLFLQTESNLSITSRQESWSFTLIDLDMALSGILNLKEMINLLEKHIEPVIEFDSYIQTSLEGQGPKPVADKVVGQLFEDEDQTLWPEALLGKLTQTRQATVSAECEPVKGLFGMKKERFVSYRLDLPVFNDSRLVGVISLRRKDEPFDDLDMIAGTSIAAQAMLIFRRTARNAIYKSRRSEAVEPSPQKQKAQVIRPKSRKGEPTSQSISTQSSEMELTDFSATDPNARLDPDGTLVPDEVMKKFKSDEASAKKTITLMSRENAGKVAEDRYREAAIEGDPLSVLIIEVDGLSRLREQDGDQVAYKVFAAIVKFIFSKVDKGKDILGRYGQNGLSVLMPRVDMNAAEKFAEGLRQFVSNARYKTAYGEKSATLSIGVAAITDDTGDYTSMVKRADMALFVAKKNGRNCVKVRL